MRSGVAVITLNGSFSRVPPCCLSPIAFHTASAARLLAGLTSRWRSTSTHCPGVSLAGSLSSSISSARSGGVMARGIDFLKVAGGAFSWATRATIASHPSSLPR